ncbi:MAG TPA: hypothetical protein VM692_02450 [Gammaproteobacteria bacterium]|nr:hypothetical protein [Gammaproteobacteria bacterium]
MVLRRIIGSSVALGLALTIGTAAAQFGPPGPPPYTPAPDAKDLKSVLFNWTWHMGMLRGVEEHELAVSLDYQGTGTMQVNGQPCTLTKYRSSINYQAPGQRIQYTCTRPNGQTVSNIEVVSGTFAWNEDTPGAELVAGQGKATPMPRTVQERLIRLWASPQGAAKAALAGAGVDLLAMNRNPGGLLQEGQTKIGNTSVAWEGSKPVVTFPIPGVSGATATATLDNRFMAERVVVKQGSTTTEFEYSNYDDWNNPLNKIEAYYAGKMVERRNGTVVRDLTTTETETGSVYVVMPVPASVGKAKGFPLLPTDRTAVLASTAETPRMDNGKPDLTGNWSAGGMNWRYGNRRCAPTQLEGCTPAWNQTLDFEFEAPSRFGPNRPLYRPEHWDKVIALDQWTNKEDPVMTCQPLGIPRQGPPRRIIQSADDVVFFYSQYGDGGGGQAEFRIIPTDGRERNARDGLETKYYGYTIGKWEGDTLVLDSTSFNDYTWLARGGFFHSDQMHVIEKLTRKGDEMLYEVIVEDPVVLLEPWVMTPRIMKLASNNVPEFPGFPPGLGVTERGHCEVYELEDISTQIRH